MNYIVIFQAEFSSKNQVKLKNNFDPLLKKNTQSISVTVLIHTN